MLTAHAGTGIFQTYIVLDVNGGGNAFYAGGINADGAQSFHGQSFTTPTSLVLKGGEVKTFKNGGGDVFNGKLFYRVYKDGATPGAFTELNLPFESNLPNFGDQRWQTVGENVDILAMATSDGTWNIEAYWLSNTNEGDRFDNNSGNNFIATFTVTGLPVTYITFTATALVDNVVLDWRTAMEENNARYEVERSRDGRTFEQIGVIEGAGTTLEEQAYRYVDASPAAGVNYYRLKQVDYDGAYAYSAVVSAKVNAKAVEVTMFPNPVMNQLQITAPAEAATVLVFDALGKVVHRLDDARLSTTAMLSMSHLPKGLYIVQVMDAQTGSVWHTARVVKQ